MAKLLTKKYQNKNKKSNAFGKTYARILHTETITINTFAAHIAEHGSPFTRDIVQGVLMKACDCLVELVKDSKKIQLGDLGLFYLSAETEGSEEEKNFSADNVKKVHLRFLPNRSQYYPLDSVSMRKVTSFTDIEKLANGSSSANGSDSDDTTIENP